MKIRLSLSSLVLGAGLALAFKPLDNRSDWPCHKCVLISSRGTGEPQGPSSAFTNTVKWTIGNSTDCIEYDTIYPANTGNASPDVGVAHVLDYLMNGTQHCPGQSYALLGYSQGAIVASRVMTRIAGTPAENYVKAIYTVGNPYQWPNMPYTYDQWGGNSTRNGTGTWWTAHTGVQNVPLWASSAKDLNICYSSDAVCNGADRFTMHSPLAHFQYIFDQKVQRMGANFLTSKMSS